MRSAFRLGPDAHQGRHHIRHIDALCLDCDRITGERISLHLVDVILYTVGQRHNQRNADDADAAGEGSQHRPRLFCHQVIKGK